MQHDRGAASKNRRMTDHWDASNTGSSGRNLCVHLSFVKSKVKQEYSSSWNFTTLLWKITWDHTVSPATRQGWLSRLYPSRSWYAV